MTTSKQTIAAAGPYLDAMLRVHVAQPPESLLGPQGLLGVVTQGAVAPALALQPPDAPLPAWLTVPSDAQLVVDGAMPDAARMRCGCCVHA